MVSSERSFGLVEVFSKDLDAHIHGARGADVRAPWLRHQRPALFWLSNQLFGDQGAEAIEIERTLCGRRFSGGDDSVSEREMGDER
jgi:hypothetical protein